MSTEIEVLIQLKSQLVNFLDELIESFPNEPDFVIFRIFVNDRIPISEIMNYITSNLCPLKDMVEKKDDNFFLNHNILFEKFNEKEKSKINHFKKLWLSPNIDKDDREVIWKWFKSFIYLGNKYSELTNKNGSLNK